MLIVIERVGFSNFVTCHREFFRVHCFVSILNIIVQKRNKKLLMCWKNWRIFFLEIVKYMMSVESRMKKFKECLEIQYHQCVECIS
jgi:hypothetical protein